MTPKIDAVRLRYFLLTSPLIFSNIGSQHCVGHINFQDTTRCSNSEDSLVFVWPSHSIRYFLQIDKELAAGDVVENRRGQEIRCAGVIPWSWIIDVLGIPKTLHMNCRAFLSTMCRRPSIQSAQYDALFVYRRPEPLQENSLG